MRAWLQICEDVPKQLDEDVPSLPDVPSKVLIPRLLQLFSSSHTEAKCLAIGVANLLAGANPESLAPSLDRSALQHHVLTVRNKVVLSNSHRLKLNYYIRDAQTQPVWRELTCVACT